MKPAAIKSLRDINMVKRSTFLVGTACAALGLVPALALAQANKPIRIGVPTAMQLQVGRDTQDAIKMAIDDINAQGRRARPQARNGRGRRDRKSRDRHQRDQETDCRREGRRAGRRLYQRRHAGAVAAHLGGQDHLPGCRLGLAGDPGQGQDRLRQLQVRIPRRPAELGAPGAPAHRLHLDASSRANSASARSPSSARTPSGCRTWCRCSRRAPPRPAPTSARPNSSMPRLRTSRRCSPRSRIPARST